MKGSSDSEPRRGVGESPHKKNCAPRSIVFSPRLARARVSLSCESALPCPGRRCVCAKASLSYQRVLGVISRRYLRGGASWDVQRHMCFGGLSANQRRLYKILPSCTPSDGARCHIPALPAWRNKPGCLKPELSANQRRLNKILPSCTVAKSPSDTGRGVHARSWRANRDVDVRR